jgi:hypothetical protein
MAIDDVLNDLLTNTKSFLEQNAIVIYGSNKNGSGQKQFVLQGTDDRNWKTTIGGARAVPFYVCYNADGFNGKGAGPKSAPFDTFYISMREFDVKSQSWEDAAATHFTLPANGPTVMVTSKINGCTFGIGSDANGARLVSHLRPPGGDVASRLQLDRGTRAGFAGGRLDVSVQSSGVMNGTVIGIRTNAAWTFYAQRFQMLNVNSVTSGMIGEVQVYH